MLAIITFNKGVALYSLDPHNMEVMSLSSSGVGTTSGSHSGSAGSSALTPTGEVSLSSGMHQSPGARALITPGMHVVCIENYNSSQEDGSLHISQGDIIEGKELINIFK